MPERLELTVDARPMPQNRTDPDVKLPPSVAAAARAAEEIHARAYAPSEPAPEPAPSVPEPGPHSAVAEPAPAHPAPQPPQPAPHPAPQPPPEDPAARHAFDPNVAAQDYYHRYISMQGRWRASQEALERMQTELQALGDELVRTQQMLASAPPPQYQNGHAPPPQQMTSLVTPADEQAFGTEVIDLARRVARETLAPELQSLRGENDQLRTQLQRTGKQTLFTILDERLPEWRQINVAPEFRRWLSLPDVYSGGVRQRLLDAAVAAADAPRTLAFFQGFLREAARGQTSQPQGAPLPAEPPPASRPPPLSLEALAAPGRARPAAGDQPAGDKPVYTRAQISKFYADVRRGAYAGREAEKSAIERDIFAAQSEGRVR